MSAHVLSELATLIRSRRSDSASKSYTKELLDAGVERCAKKLGEEAVDLADHVVAISRAPFDQRPRG